MDGVYKTNQKKGHPVHRSCASCARDINASLPVIRLDPLL